jgi:adenylylsulfate kinase
MTARAGMVVWMTGLPSSGKSTMAGLLERRLRARRVSCLRLDGDEVRARLWPNLGHDEADRDRFYLRLAQLAANLARDGLVVLVAATANRRHHRLRARHMVQHFVEVHVATAAVECQRRDAKGLYARQAGEGLALPGAGVPYEAPEAAEVVARDGRDEAALAVIEELILNVIGAHSQAGAQKEAP